eukprot:CAMPEP_0196653094 /NCGR_PEP_ID=MMETSP1086-20130531/2692_1 /TAXON_ID=77921 /ORGANISM="Cyanoptyche  gloeocystis , Strain SAG4.97" /LENGTH=90 /DNA_ID=CAMNT_0041984101 /DNA_START=106 /DNA_END=375 /DNA_ORIENTATION=-
MRGASAALEGRMFRGVHEGRIAALRCAVQVTTTRLNTPQAAIRTAAPAGQATGQHASRFTLCTPTGQAAVRCTDPVISSKHRAWANHIVS